MSFRLLIMTAFVLFAVTSFAQQAKSDSLSTQDSLKYREFNFGFGFGMNQYKFRDIYTCDECTSTSEGTTGFQFAVYNEFKFSDKFSLELRPGWTARWSEISGDDSTTTILRGPSFIVGGNMNFPVYGRFNVSEGRLPIFLKVGPSYQLMQMPTRGARRKKLYGQYSIDAGIDMEIELSNMTLVPDLTFSYAVKKYHENHLGYKVDTLMFTMYIKV